MQEVHFFDRIDWLGPLEPAESSRLRARSIRTVHERGDTVFAPAAEPRSVYLLESGSVRIYRLSPPGEEATLGYVAPGEVFGELPGLGEFARDSFATAHARSATWKIPVELFRKLLRAHPDMMREVVRQVGERMKRVEARVEDLILRDVRQRLASVLLGLSEHLGEPTGDGVVLRISLPQMQLGTLIGATRQSVNAAMSGFQAEGWVSQRGTTITVLEPDRLRELIDP